MSFWAWKSLWPGGPGLITWQSPPQPLGNRYYHLLSKNKQVSIPPLLPSKRLSPGALFFTDLLRSRRLYFLLP